MTARRATLWVGVLATLAYANAVPNGFAYDDTTILAQNDVVTEGRVWEAWVRPYWPRHAEQSGLYRPVTISSFAAEWRLFGSNPVGYHALNVGMHGVVSLLVLWLLMGWAGVAAATAGAAVFAVHPLHTEAVANIVGRSELYAAALVLAALWLYDRGRRWNGATRRLGRLLGVGGFYFLALGAKEIAVTLPALMLLTDFLSAPKTETTAPRTEAAEVAGLEGAVGEEALGSSKRLSRALGRTWRDIPTYAMCLAVLGAYLALRLEVVGALLGELPAPSLQGLSSSERIATALSLWPQFIRLLVFPVSLSADYSPAVLLPVRSLMSAEALTGALVLVVLIGLVAATAKRAPLVAAGIAWFGVSVSPISHFLFPTGVLLAERTLYLPSVGLALVVAGAWIHVSARASVASLSTRRALPITAVVVVGLMMARTVERNPTWMSTFTVLDTLAQDHPEASLALRTRATGLVRAGDVRGGTRMYELAIELAPANYAILTEVGNFYTEQREWNKGEQVLLQAIELAPNQAAAYRLLAGQLILREQYREAHRLALNGLAAFGADRELFALVSETYIAKGDLGAAIRARHAALGQDPESIQDLERLVHLHTLAGDSTSVAKSRARLLEVRRSSPGKLEFTPTGRIVQNAPVAVPGSGR